SRSFFLRRTASATGRCARHSADKKDRALRNRVRTTALRNEMAAGQRRDLRPLFDQTSQSPPADAAAARAGSGRFAICFWSSRRKSSALPQNSAILASLSKYFCK